MNKLLLGFITLCVLIMYCGKGVELADYTNKLYKLYTQTQREYDENMKELTMDEEIDLNHAKEMFEIGLKLVTKLLKDTENLIPPENGREIQKAYIKYCNVWKTNIENTSELILSGQLIDTQAEEYATKLINARKDLEDTIKSYAEKYSWDIKK